MTKNTKRIVRDIKSAPARTQLYVSLLTRKHGVTADGMGEAVLAAFPERRAEGYTKHNSYSLGLLAATYGYRFFSEQYTDGKHYFFASPKNDAKEAAKALKAKEAKAQSKASKPSLPSIAIASDKAPSVAPGAIAKASKARGQGAKA